MAYLEPKSRFSLPSRVRRWFKEADPSIPASWQERVYADVGDFLFTHRLDPTPDNYDLAFQYRAAVNAGLVAAIRAEIDRAGVLDVDAAEQIFAENAGPVGADALSALARAIADQAQGLTRIASQSGHDARAFRVAIEEQSARGEAGAILELTGTMVARTRSAEQQLRQAQRELNGLKSTLAEAQRVADVDPLTELPNRRAVKRDLEAAIGMARVDHGPLNLAFVDIDHFKRVNDVHGHETGDRVLRYVALLLARQFAGVGTVGRFGGEEFVIMIPALTLRDARAAVDECRKRLAERHLYAARDGASIGSVTFSAGVTTFVAGDGTTEMLRRADEALYRAKADGRDRVVIG